MYKPHTPYLKIYPSRGIRNLNKNISLFGCVIYFNKKALLVKKNLGGISIAAILKI